MISLCTSIKVRQLYKSIRHKVPNIVSFLRKSQLNARPIIGTRHNMNKTQFLFHNYNILLVNLNKGNNFIFHMQRTILLLFLIRYTLDYNESLSYPSTSLHYFPFVCDKGRQFFTVHQIKLYVIQHVLYFLLVSLLPISDERGWNRARCETRFAIAQKRTAIKIKCTDSSRASASRQS